MDIKEMYKAIREEYDVHDRCYQEWQDKKDSAFYVRESNFNEGWCMALGYVLDLMRDELDMEV